MILFGSKAEDDQPPRVFDWSRNVARAVSAQFEAHPHIVISAKDCGRYNGWSRLICGMF
jgi:hypothetical protein